MLQWMRNLNDTQCVIHYVIHITFYLLWVQALGFSIIITVSCRVSSLPLKSSVLSVFFPLPPKSLATTDLFTFSIILPFLECCVVQPLSRVRLFVIPWAAAHQASLSFTNSQILLKLISVELVMPSYHLILCCPLFLLPSVFPSIRVFSNESAFCIRWPEYWSFSFSIRPSSDYLGLISFRIDWFDLLAV